MTTGIEALTDDIVLTVGIPAYNAASSLETALLSILRQTWRGTMEILVVDDGSTDDTVAIATRLARRYGAVRVVRHDRNRGRPTARNTILREARGRYLTWMDADDEWYPNKLAVQFDHLLGHAAADDQPVICMCAFDWKWAHSTRKQHRVPDVSGDQLKGLLNGRIGAYLWTMLAPTSAFRDVGEFDENLPRLQDLDFLIRFVARGGSLIVSDPRRPLCIYHKSDEDKPGRVIADSLSHIWRKHYPLFRQYGRGFCRGSRRRHLLLAARHGFSNEGWAVGAGYYVRAAFASPGWLLHPIRSRLSLTPPEQMPQKLETFREEGWVGEPIPRSTAATGAVDLVVSLSRAHDEALRSYLREWGPQERSAGLWYVPPAIGLRKNARDHAELLELVDSDDEELVDGARRLLRAAAVSNAGGTSSLLYLGAPLEVDRDSATSLGRAVERLAAQLKRLSALATDEAGLRPVRLHFLVPDTETLLWRRYLHSLEGRPELAFEAWLPQLGDGDPALLDHRVLQPLCRLPGYAAVRVHVFAAGSTLDQLVHHFVTELPGPARDALRAPPAVALAAPSRNQGLPIAERLLAAYTATLSDQHREHARAAFYAVPPSREPLSASAPVNEWLATRCRLIEYERRFHPAQATVHAAAAVPVYANDMVVPRESPEDFERVWRDLQVLSAAAQARASAVTQVAQLRGRA